ACREAADRRSVARPAAVTLGDRSIAIARTIVGLTQGLGIWIVHDDPEVDLAEGERLVRSYTETATACPLPLRCVSTQTGKSLPRSPDAGGDARSRSGRPDLDGVAGAL